MKVNFVGRSEQREINKWGIETVEKNLMIE